MIVTLVALVVVLLAVVLWLAFRAGMGASTMERIVQLPGMQFLLGRLDLGWAGIHTRGQRLLEQGAALEQEGKTAEALQLY
ncbi:MAG: hypothetical protein ACYS7Y_32595, partial [Planctomycetota bacterium]